MLWQLHWQRKDSEKPDFMTTVFISQRDINSNDEMRLFVKETQESHPIPDDACWMACNEKSKHFVLTTAE